MRKKSLCHIIGHDWAVEQARQSSVIVTCLGCAERYRSYIMPGMGFVWQHKGRGDWLWRRIESPPRAVRRKAEERRNGPKPIVEALLGMGGEA